MALQRMQNTIGEAATGSAMAAHALGQLGLSVESLKGLSADQQFAAIAEQMQQVGDKTKRTQITLDIFGRSGGELINLLSGGAEGLNEFGKEAEAMGLLEPLVAHPPAAHRRVHRRVHRRAPCC